MTEEENAEEYAKGLCKTCSLDTCRNNTLHTCSIKEYIKQAFLAGAEPREKRIAELEKELGKVEGFLEDEKMEYYELENLKNNEIAELKAYNEKLLDGDIEKHNKIVELQNRNGELAGQKASLERWLGEAKEIMQKLIANAPNTYSGTNIEIQQKKMFSFQDAVNKAEPFLKESE